MIYKTAIQIWNNINKLHDGDEESIEEDSLWISKENHEAEIKRLTHLLE